MSYYPQKNNKKKTPEPVCHNTEHISWLQQSESSPAPSWAQPLSAFSVNLLHEHAHAQSDT